MRCACRCEASNAGPIGRNSGRRPAPVILEGFDGAGETPQQSIAPVSAPPREHHHYILIRSETGFTNLSRTILLCPLARTMLCCGSLLKAGCMAAVNAIVFLVDGGIHRDRVAPRQRNGFHSRTNRYTALVAFLPCLDCFRQAAACRGRR